MNTWLSMAVAGLLWGGACGAFAQRPDSVAAVPAFRWLDRDGDGVNDLEPRHGDLDGDGLCDTVLDASAPLVGTGPAPAHLAEGLEVPRPAPWGPDGDGQRRLDYFVDENGDGIGDGRVLPLHPGLQPGRRPDPRLLLLQHRARMAMPHDAHPPRPPRDAQTHHPGKDR